MRNPSRIDGVLAEIKTVWQKVPDWRFMQLMCNLQRMYGSDMFYIEDDRFVEILKNYLEVN